MTPPEARDWEALKEEIESGRITEVEAAVRDGVSRQAIHSGIKRRFPDFKARRQEIDIEPVIPPPPEWIRISEAAQAVGKEAALVGYWADCGYVAARQVEGPRSLRLVNLDEVRQFAANPPTREWPRAADDIFSEGGLDRDLVFRFYQRNKREGGAGLAQTRRKHLYAFVRRLMDEGHRLSIETLAEDILAFCDEARLYNSLREFWLFTQEGNHVRDQNIENHELRDDAAAGQLPGSGDHAG